MNAYERVKAWRAVNSERNRKWNREYRRKRRNSDASGDALSSDEVMAKARSARRSRKTHCGRRTCPAALKFYFHLRYADRKPEYLARATARSESKKREYRKRWKVKNPAKVLLHGRFRKRALKQASPPWLTHDQWAEMHSIYHEAQRLSGTTGIQHHVDHIVPLRGRGVCGLHVPWNLRVLTAQANMRRSR